MTKGIYDYIANIQATEWVEYGALLILVMFLMTRVIRPTWLQLVSLVIGILFIFYRTDKRISTTDRAYTELEFRLKELHPKPENFHIDADILNFYYNMKDFRKYHPDGYDESLVATDNMLKIVTEMEGGVFNCAENLDIVREQMNKAMNHFQTIIFGLPNDLMIMRRHKRALNALHIILRRHVDRMVVICQQQSGGSPREVDRAEKIQRASEWYSASGYKETGSLDERTIDINWKPVYNSGPRPNDLQNIESSAFDFYY